MTDVDQRNFDLTAEIRENRNGICTLVLNDLDRHKYELEETKYDGLDITDSLNLMHQDGLQPIVKHNLTVRTNFGLCEPVKTAQIRTTCNGTTWHTVHNMHVSSR